MITIDKAHKLIQKYLNITENQYEIKYYNYDEKCFRLYGSGFEIGFSEKWVNENNLISIIPDRDLIVYLSQAALSFESQGKYSAALMFYKILFNI